MSLTFTNAFMYVFGGGIFRGIPRLVISLLVFLLIAGILQAPFLTINLTGFTFCNTPRYFNSTLQAYILQCNEVMDLNVAACPTISDVVLPNLQYVLGTLTVDNLSCASSLSFPSLQYANSLIVINNPNLVDLSFPQLLGVFQLTYRRSTDTDVCTPTCFFHSSSNFIMSSNPNLTSISMPLLTGAHYLEINNNDKLWSLSINSSSTVALGGYYLNPPLGWLIGEGGGLIQVSIQSNSALRFLHFETTSLVTFCDPTYSTFEDIYCGLFVANNSQLSNITFSGYGFSGNAMVTSNPSLIDISGTWTWGPCTGDQCSTDPQSFIGHSNGPNCTVYLRPEDSCE